MNKFDIKGKKVIIIGATGGLGTSFFRYFDRLGAMLILVGRSVDKLKYLANGHRFYQCDLLDNDSIVNLANQIKNDFGKIDIVINASGYDVRKKLIDHSYDDISRVVDINLKASINLTRLFSPVISDTKHSSIVHIGGFADGKLAFPYYTADVASRAGIYSFMEAINRELDIEGKKWRVKYFCPNPTDTEAERPFHKLWKDMKISISPLEDVNKELYKLISKPNTTRIMGGIATLVFSKINLLSPKLATKLLIRNYGILLKKFLYKEEVVDEEEKKGKGCKGLLGRSFLLISTFLYFLLPLTLCAQTTIECKALVTSTLVGSSEILWWLGLLLVGKEVADKLKGKSLKNILSTCKRRV